MGMQCAAIIGVVFACAGVRIRTSVMAVTVGAIVLGMLAANFHRSCGRQDAGKK
jgi:hypothetical protein